MSRPLCDERSCLVLATHVLYERGVARENQTPIYACDAHVDEMVCEIGDAEAFGLAAPAPLTDEDLMGIAASIPLSIDEEPGDLETMKVANVALLAEVMRLRQVSAPADGSPVASVTPIRSSALAVWLREIADEAERGELVAAAVAGVKRNGAVVTNWCDPSRESRVSMIAAASVLAHGLITDDPVSPEHRVLGLVITALMARLGVTEVKLCASELSDLRKQDVTITAAEPVWGFGGTIEAVVAPTKGE